MVQLTDVLPKLASLHIARLPLVVEFVASLMQSPALLHLQLDNTLVFESTTTTR